MSKKISVYNDSKVLPLYNFERILETKDYNYLVRGYEFGDEINVDIDLESKYNSIITDYLMDLNAKNKNIVNYGIILSAEMELFFCEKAIDLINKNKEFHLYKTIYAVMDLEVKTLDDSIEKYLKALKIQRVEDTEKQIQILKRRVLRKKSDLKKAKDKLNEKEDEGGELDISKIITNVELILERTIDMQKTSLYRFSIMQSQAENKIKKLTQIQNKNGK